MFNSKLKQEVEELKQSQRELNGEVFGREFIEYSSHLFIVPIINKEKSLSEKIKTLEENQKLIMDYLKVEKVVVKGTADQVKLIKK